MAIFHLHVKNISRGSGRSVLAAAAYRAGETLPNEAEERDSAFGGRRDVLHAEIRAPGHAPLWMSDRAQLWNGVEAAEVRKDARLAKEIEVALPRELGRPQWLSVVRELADAYVAQGFVVDLAIHDDGTAANPHAHLLLTTRILSSSGFGGKIRDADGKKFVLDARKLWAKITNTTFASSGSSITIDHRSHADAGVNTVPSEHRGPDRNARRQRRLTMSSDRIEEARAELLKDGTFEGQYQALAGRADWPPESRILPEGLSAAEKSEFDRYWEHVEMQADLKDIRQPMADHELPVPDPEETLISQEQLDRAQDAMILEMQRPPARGEEWFQRPHHPTERVAAARIDPPAASQKDWFVTRQRSAEAEEEVRVQQRERE